MQSIILNSFFNPKSHNDRNDNIIKLPDQCMNDLMILLGKQEGVNVKSPLTKYDWTVKMCKKPVIDTKYLVVVGNLTKQNEAIAINPLLTIHSEFTSPVRETCTRLLKSTQSDLLLSYRLAFFVKEFELSALYSEGGYNKVALTCPHSFTIYTGILSGVKADRLKVGYKYRLIGTLVSKVLCSSSETELAINAILPEHKPFYNTTQFRRFFNSEQLIPYLPVRRLENDNQVLTSSW